MTLFKIKGLTLSWKKIREWKLFTKSVVISWVLVSCHKPLPCHVLCPYGLWNWIYNVFYLSWDYIWSCDQRIMWLFAWWQNTISHHLVEFGSHEPYENRYRTFFNRHLTIVSCDHCGWCLLLINHYHCCLFKFQGTFIRQRLPVNASVAKREIRKF